jgi:hypothetical protein
MALILQYFIANHTILRTLRIVVQQAHSALFQRLLHSFRGHNTSKGLAKNLKTRVFADVSFISPHVDVFISFKITLVEHPGELFFLVFGF